jgi:hypothetical protein
MPIATAPNVTSNDPMMIGKMPHTPSAKLSVGRQTLDIKKFGPAWMRNGNPSAKMNAIMRKIAQTDEIPHSKRSNSMVRPLMSWVADLRSDRTALFGFMLISPRKKGGRRWLVFVYFADTSLIATSLSPFNIA